MQAQAYFQSEFCHGLWEEFKVKKIKRRFQHPGSVAAGTSAAAVAAAEEDETPTPDEMARKSVGTLTVGHIFCVCFRLLSSLISRYQHVVDLSFV